MNSINNIRRNKSKSIICILVSGIMVLLLNIYIGNMVSIRAQLYELPEVMPVYCFISNLNGTQRSGLTIKEEIYDNLLKSKHVSKMKCKLSLWGGIGEFAPENYREKLNLSIAAVNDIAAFREDTANLVNMGSYKELRFPKKNVLPCIVNEGLMEQKNWKIGDVIPLNLYYYQHEQYNMLSINPLALKEYQIAGSMKETISDAMEEAQIILPLKSVEELFSKQNIPFYVESLSFYVKDPLKLNEFKEEMDSYSLLPVMPKTDFSTDGNALNVKDTTFIAAASTLRQEENLLKSFLPMVFAMVFFIGYIISSLLMNSRKSEFRLMRIIGLSKGRVTIIFSLEQLLLVVTGALAGILVILLFGGFQMSVLLTAGCFCLSYCLGCLVALMGMSHKSIMENQL